MKNIENYGVLELKRNEIAKIDGGWWLLKGLVVRFVYEIGADWDANVAAFKENFNAASQN